MKTSATPDSQKYAAAFKSVSGVTARHVRMLRVHYYAPERTLTATEMAHALGSDDYAVANSHYGKLAHLIGEELRYHPTRVHLGALVTFDKRQGQWHWIMRPEVADAIELLGWVGRENEEAEKIGLSDVSCKALLETFHYSNDARKAPDTFRHGRFHEGWLDAAIRELTYSPKTLERLTWANLGYRLGKYLGAKPDAEIDVFFERFAAHYREMHSAQEAIYSLPDEVDETAVYSEGTVRQVVVNAYERNPNARQRCIDRYGAVCFVCGFDFGKVYGELGEGFIHVHHLRPLSSIREGYQIDPIVDLRPVCPNCHAIIHRRTPVFSIEEVQSMLRRGRDQSINPDLSQAAQSKF